MQKAIRKVGLKGPGCPRGPPRKPSGKVQTGQGTNGTRYQQESTFQSIFPLGEGACEPLRFPTSVFPLGVDRHFLWPSQVLLSLPPSQGITQDV